MNDLIQKLADQAEDYADSIVDQGGEFHVAYTRRLAELIVQECKDILAWHGEDSAVEKLNWFSVNKMGIK